MSPRSVAARASPPAVPSGTQTLCARPGWQCVPRGHDACRQSIGTHESCVTSHRRPASQALASTAHEGPPPVQMLFLHTSVRVQSASETQGHPSSSISTFAQREKERHRTLQRSGCPRRISCVHWSPSVQAEGQFPSHVSPGSILPFPQLVIVLQSESLLALAPWGQHMSASLAAMTGMCKHSAVHCAALPSSISTVQALLSSQAVGHGASLLFGSHVSPTSRFPSPHFFEQSLSALKSAPVGQHPSPDLALVISCTTHSASQVAAEPLKVTIMQALEDGHDTGQSGPSQISCPSRLPLPHTSRFRSPRPLCSSARPVSTGPASTRDPFTGSVSELRPVTSGSMQPALCSASAA